MIQRHIPWITKPKWHLYLCFRRRHSPASMSVLLSFVNPRSALGLLRSMPHQGPRCPELRWLSDLFTSDMLDQEKRGSGLTPEFRTLICFPSPREIFESSAPHWKFVDTLKWHFCLQTFGHNPQGFLRDRHQVAAVWLSHWSAFLSEVHVETSGQKVHIWLYLWWKLPRVQPHLT